MLDRSEILRILVRAIGSIGLLEEVVVGWDTNHQRILKSFLEEKVITRGDLRDIVHIRIIELGRRTLEMQSRAYSSPTCSHHALAYAVRNDALSNEELLLIRCDSVKSLDEFVASYDPEQLLENVMRQLVGKLDPVQTELFEANGLPASPDPQPS